MTWKREDRYSKVVWDAFRADGVAISASGANFVARAVMAIADQEQAELRAEVERLTRKLRSFRNDALSEAAEDLISHAAQSGPTLTPKAAPKSPAERKVLAAYRLADVWMTISDRAIADGHPWAGMTFGDASYRLRHVLDTGAA